MIPGTRHAAVVAASIGLMAVPYAGATGPAGAQSPPPTSATASVSTGEGSYRVELTRLARRQVNHSGVSWSPRTRTLTLAGVGPATRSVRTKMRAAPDGLTVRYRFAAYTEKALLAEAGRVAGDRRVTSVDVPTHGWGLVVSTENRALFGSLTPGRLLDTTMAVVVRPDLSQIINPSAI